jgi:hypothetical protein
MLFLSGEELSEEFQEKARTIFEAALLDLKFLQVKEAIEEQYAAALAEEVEEIKAQLPANVLMHTLSMLLTSGCKKMHLFIEQGLKTEMTEISLQE